MRTITLLILIFVFIVALTLTTLSPILFKPEPTTIEINTCSASYTSSKTIDELCDGLPEAICRLKNVAKNEAERKLAICLCERGLFDSESENFLYEFCGGSTEGCLKKIDKYKTQRCNEMNLTGVACSNYFSGQAASNIEFLCKNTSHFFPILSL